jgi:hypothetical protein
MARKSFVDNRFNYFLSIFISLILVSPFFPPIGTKGVFPFVLLFYTAAVIVMLKTMIADRMKFTLAAAVCAGILFLSVLFAYIDSPWAETLDLAVNGAGLIVLALFLRRLFRELFKTSKVNVDSIKGGVCIYFLIGLFWAVLYRLIYYFNPASFVYNLPGSANLFYFSYVTLATLGYGDIVPATRLAQALAILEAITGQIFLAVYIARLLGLHMAGEMKKE